MTYKLIIEKQALDDLKHLTKSGRKSDIKKAQQILEELKIQPEFGGQSRKIKIQFIRFLE